MTQAEQARDNGMFLYEQPELLTQNDHGKLGLTIPGDPYQFAAGIRAVPLTLSEFASAERHYPIVFTSLENPYPLAVVGLEEGDNLYVQDGNWEEERYIPAYLRCHPFAFAAEKDGRIAILIDRAAKTIAENPEHPFFDGDKLSPQTESMVRMCAEYDADRKRTEQFCAKLKDLGLLSTQRASHTPNEGGEAETLSTYVSINAEVLSKLDDSAVVDMHRSGQLSAAYLQLYSLENWQGLLWRRALRKSRADNAS